MSDFIKREIKSLKEKGLFMMESVAGSHLYNLNTPSSDLDIRGVFAPNLENLLLEDYLGEISDEDQDVKYYSLPKFIDLALDCNPNIIELLYVPEEKMNFSSEAWKKILSFRDSFISKKSRTYFFWICFCSDKEKQRRREKSK